MNPLKYKAGSGRFLRVGFFWIVPDKHHKSRARRNHREYAKLAQIRMFELGQ